MVRTFLDHTAMLGANPSPHIAANKCGDNLLGLHTVYWGVRAAIERG
ncbi:hypothetical protein HWB07_gp245 [Bacillus phage vB_BsuM-Goe3]|uniref:Uncharacterized protein n=1 Tax=Bacillus phage vB_BsuM-Goe3 TaxID=1933063 RepID=A0A1Z1D9R3_BPGO3|nr:hypothetical protein HWB07_gp245 [Bacillus phage vB_BsuM-Goe3]APZ82525.1 hypothetical protein Goe3_c06000 [Bacillus phage vB_BsuM-Goe3]